MISDHKHGLDIHIYKENKAYGPMWEQQNHWVQEIDQGKRDSSLLFLEHPHVYTLGRAAKEQHLLISKEECQRQGIEIFEIDRGGDITYHGPGQLVGYPIILLNGLQIDPHQYLRLLEESLIATLAHYQITAERKPPFTGVWVKDEKIAAIGIKFNRGRLSKAFITSHGFALNVHTNLDMFQYIIPCGIKEYGVTSMEKLTGMKYIMEEVIHVFKEQFCNLFQFNEDEHIIYH